MGGKGAREESMSSELRCKAKKGRQAPFLLPARTSLSNDLV